MKIARCAGTLILLSFLLTTVYTYADERAAMKEPAKTARLCIHLTADFNGENVKISLGLERLFHTGKLFTDKPGLRDYAAEVCTTVSRERHAIMVSVAKSVETDNDKHETMRIETLEFFDIKDAEAWILVRYNRNNEIGTVVQLHYRNSPPSYE